MAFFETTARLYVHLHPSSLENPAAALEQELNAKVLQYDEILKGVVLAYDNIKVEEPNGRVRIFQDSHLLNVHVSVRLLLFCPKPGIKLVGEVNYLTSNSVGLLVHGIFNAAIQEDHIPDEWDFFEDDDADKSFWGMGDQRMEVGTLVAFEVVDFRNTDEILSIQASILDEDKYGVIGKAPQPFAERHRVDASNEVMLDISGNPKTPATTPGSTGRKKRKGDGVDDEHLSDAGASGAKRKKRKKDAQMSGTSNEVPVEEDQQVTNSKMEKEASAKKEKKQKKEKKDKKAKKDKKEKNGH